MTNMIKSLLNIGCADEEANNGLMDEEANIGLMNEEENLLDHSISDYRMEEARLRSYKNWPRSYMDPAKLAAAGFYYTGEGDKVRCFECNVGISQWLEGDDPMADHQRWQDRCRFIRKISCGNIPIDKNCYFTLKKPEDFCALYGKEYQVGAAPDGHSSSTFELLSVAECRLLEISGQPKEPAHPEYERYEARLKTFETWPKFMSQTKERLTDAGFYYTGEGDQTLCYCCGGGLKDWEPNDDPWEQHVEWFSKCYYLQMFKRQSYIDTILARPILKTPNEEIIGIKLPSYINKVEHQEDVPPGTITNDTAAGPIEDMTVESKITVETKTPKDVKANNDARMCKICFAEELGVVFLPCGHMVACISCASDIAICALCRQPIKMTVRAFFS